MAPRIEGSIFYDQSFETQTCMSHSNLFSWHLNSPSRVRLRRASFHIYYTESLVDILNDTWQNSFSSSFSNSPLYQTDPLLPTL